MYIMDVIVSSIIDTIINFEDFESIHKLIGVQVSMLMVERYALHNLQINAFYLKSEFLTLYVTGSGWLPKFGPFKYHP
jgi:hypothetical protein